jgi:hypothetical protein
MGSEIRYSSSQLYQIHDEKRNETKVHLGRRRFVQLDDLEGEWEYYTVKDGDTLELIAYERSDDSDNWYIIADLNRDKIKHPWQLRTGMSIIVPTERGFELV